jgi:flavin-dependent dehydrogenase
MEFDHALARIAASRGAIVHAGTRVTSARAENGVGVVDTTSGAVRARIIVGADGIASVVRRALGLGAGLLRAQVLEIETPPCAGDPASDVLHFDVSNPHFTGYSWDFPCLVHGHPMVSRGVYALNLREPRADLDVLLGSKLAHLRVSALDLAKKRYSERGLVTGDVIARGPLMLVGEAAGIDPATGEGIAQAIEYGDLAGRFLARAIDRGTPVKAWRRVVKRSRLYFDLGLRRRAALALYGPNGARVRQLLLSNSSFIEASSRYFAAKRVPPPLALRALVGTGRAWLESRRGAV